MKSINMVKRRERSQAGSQAVTPPRRATPPRPGRSPARPRGSRRYWGYFSASRATEGAPRRVPAPGPDPAAAPTTGGTSLPRAVEDVPVQREADRHQVRPPVRVGRREPSARASPTCRERSGCGTWTVSQTARDGPWAASKSRGKRSGRTSPGPPPAPGAFTLRRVYRGPSSTRRRGRSRGRRPGWLRCAGTPTAEAVIGAASVAKRRETSSSKKVRPVPPSPSARAAS